MAEVPTNINLTAIDYSEMASNIVRFTLWLLFVNFAKALQNTNFNSYLFHIELVQAFVSDWAACLSYVHLFLKNTECLILTN